MIEDIVKIISANQSRIDTIEQKLLSDQNDQIRQIRIDELRNLHETINKFNLIAQTAMVDYFSSKIKHENK